MFQLLTYDESTTTESQKEEVSAEGETDAKIDKKVNDWLLKSKDQFATKRKKHNFSSIL